jgi:ATP-dependent Clp protease ATP-binding subunit ClpB
MLDDGRLTDSQGRTVDFRNTLVIMTSNLGADALAQLPEGAPSSVRPLVKLSCSRSDASAYRVLQAARGAVMSAVRQALAPEFINRIDELVLFNRLGRGVMADIVQVQLRGVEKARAGSLALWWLACSVCDSHSEKCCYHPHA